MRELHTATFPDGRTQTRYQQVVDGASVFGGQITIIRSAAGEAETVIGAHFPALHAKNKAKLTKSEAKQKVAKEIGTEGDFDSTLRLDPKTGRLFYQVQSIRADERPVRWVDATTGETIKAFDAVTKGEGVGVKGDTKHLDSTLTAGRHLPDAVRGQAPVHLRRDEHRPYDAAAGQADDRRRRRLERAGHDQPRPGGRSRRALLRQRGGRLLRRHLRPQQHRRPGHADHLGHPLRPGLLQRLLERVPT